MAKKKNTPAPQTDAVPQASSVQQSAADIPVQDLKARFQARSIPLETDFADLIDVADCGRKAVGLSPDFPPVQETGLNLDDTTGLLTVKPDPAGGLAVSAAGTAVKPDPAGGLIVSTTGAAVKQNAARGVIVDANGVGVNYDATLHIVNSNQLGVTDNYVTKNSDSTITGGGLTFASDDKGITFYGGSRIIKKSGGNMRWYKGTNNALPQICDNNGNNPSNIATESYVDSKTSMIRRTISIPGAMSKDIFFSGVDSYTQGSMTFFIDCLYMFTLTWRFYFDYGNSWLSQGIITVSDVSGSSTKLTNVTYGRTISTGYGSCLYLNFSGACTVECFYNPMNIYGCYLFSGGYSIHEQAKFIPVEAITTSYAFDMLN